MCFRTALALVCAALISSGAHADGYQSVGIVSPEPEETVHDNNGNLTVTVVAAPQLRVADGDRFVLLLDDTIVAEGTGEAFELSGIDRGSHTVQVRVEAADGTVLAASPPMTFHMWRASRLFRKRAP